jgi:hypothetical protein
MALSNWPVHPHRSTRSPYNRSFLYPVEHLEAKFLLTGIEGGRRTLMPLAAAPEKKYEISHVVVRSIRNRDL